jgi:hypothetical protein
VLDDWFLLANARFDGWWQALGGELLRARPGSGAVYAVTIGLVGRHPPVALVVQVLLASAAAIALWDLARQFLGRAEAFAVAALWVLLPNHGSLLYWATGTAITAALLLLLLGVRLLVDGRLLAASLLVGASVLTYEATAPAAALALIAVPSLQGRPWRRPLVVGAAVLLPVAAWVVLARPSVKRGLDQTADLGQVLPAHVGWGVLPTPFDVAGGLFACLVATFVVVEAGRSRRVTHEAALLGAGAALIVAGTLPFVRYFYAPLGFGDRVNVVAAVGTALLWTALLEWTVRQATEHLPAGRVVAGVVTGAVLLGFAGATLQRADAWADAGDDAAAVLAGLAPLEPGDEVTLTRSTLRRNVAAFLDDSNITGAVQLEAGTRDVRARLRPGR